MSIHDETNVTDLTRYMSRTGDELYVGNVLVNSGAEYEGETYISCGAHGRDNTVFFDVSAEAENKGQGLVELIRWLWQHREC